MVEKTNNIDDAEIKYKQALKNYHKESNRHVLVLEADVTEEQKRMILHTSNLIRIAGNCLATVMKRNYEQLVRTKRYRNLKSLYKKAKDTDDKKLLASVTAQIQEIQESYNVTWDFCRKEMNKIKDIYHINSIFARSKAEDVWSGIKKCLYGDGNTIHFKKYGDYPEIRAKEIKRGISVYPVVSDNGNNSLKLHIMKSEFNLTVNKPKHNKTRSGNIISDILEPHDRFAEDEVNAVCRYLENPDVIDKAAVDLYEKTGELLDSYRPCYVSLVIREIRGELRIFAHITIEGTAKTKFNKDGTRRHQYGKGFIGCDIGPQSIAYTSKEEVGLKNLAERGASIKAREQKEARILRKMDRSRRAMNPENYNDDGTVRRGKKTWKKSNRYKKLHSQYRNICRIAAENRHLAINEEVNHMRALGNVFITEPKNAKKLQKRSKKTERQDKPSVVQKSDGTEQLIYKYKRKKRHGKSIKNRCPGYFQAQAKAKFERTGGVYIEVSATYRASQYDHTCNKYIKKALSQRMYELTDGTRVQRDWYSSFLMYCIGTDLQNISRYKCKRYFDELYAKYLKLEQYIINNKITVMNSGIKFKAA